MNRCDCQASLDGIFPDRHENGCATRTGLDPEQRARMEDRYVAPDYCGATAFTPKYRSAILYCGLGHGSHTTHVALSLRTGDPLWEWEQGTPVRPYGQKREAA